MKRKSYLALLLILCLLCACGGSRVTAADASLEAVSAELQAEFSPSAVSVLSRDYMLLLYGLDASDYTEGAAFRVKQLAFPDECILLKAADEGRVPRLLELLESYRHSVLEQSRSYEPESYAVFEKCAAASEGLYVWLFLSAKNPELTQRFRSHLKPYAPEEAPVFTPAPTPAPTPEPVPTLEPVPETVTEVPALPYGLVPESARAEDAWFRDSLFVGTSVAENLRDCVFARRQNGNPACMDNTVFFTASNYSYMKALESPDALSPLWQGQPCTVEDAVARMGAKRVYLNLGYCDLVLRMNVDVNEIVSDAAELVRRIREKSPQVTVIFVSVTPRLREFDLSHYGAPRIRELNAALLQWAEAHECYYIDCYTPLSDGDGGLHFPYHLSYGPEDGAHLNSDGAGVWLDTLYTHTIP